MDLIPKPAAGPRPPLLHRVTHGQLVLLDRLIAGLLSLIAVVHLFRIVGGVSPSLPEVGTTVLWSLAAVSIAVRRQNALLALVLMTAGVLAGAAWRTGTDASNVPDLLIALPMFQVAATTDRRPSLAILGGELLVLATATAVSGTLGGGLAAPAAALVAVASWFVGDSVRVRRVYVAGLAEQAAQRQREALERAQRAVAEERLQIARELHDVVAHSLSVIAIQSGVGRHVINVNRTEAKRALAAVEETSRAALDELRRMLGVLRGDDHSPADRVPAPGIANLGRLVEQVQAAGVPVELAVSSVSARTLSPAAELSVYRIVQEALTNVVKHAGPAKAYVGLRDEGSELVLEVLDDGLGAGVLTPYPGSVPEVAGHHGLIGMRERVSLFDGSFAAAPRPEGGFRVVARFPLQRVSAA